MSSSTTARTRPWEDKSFAHFASRCPVRLQPWFAQPNEEIDRMRLALNTGKALAPTYPKLEDADFDVLLAKVNAYEPEDQPLEPLYRLAFQHRRRLLGVAEAARVGNMDSFRRFNAALDLRADVGMYRRTLASLDARTKAHPSADAGKLIERLSLDQAWKPSFPRPDLLYTLHGPVMDLLESLGLPSMPAISEVWGGERIAAALERTLVAGSLDGKFEMKVVVSDTARSALVERSGRITIPKSYQLNGLDAYVLMARLRLSVERYYRGYLSNYYVLWNGTVDDLTAGLGILAVVEQILRGQIDRYAGKPATWRARWPKGSVESVSRRTTSTRPCGRTTASWTLKRQRAHQFIPRRMTGPGTWSGTSSRAPTSCRPRHTSVCAREKLRAQSTCGTHWLAILGSSSTQRWGASTSARPERSVCLRLPESSRL